MRDYRMKMLKQRLGQLLTVGHSYVTWFPKNKIYSQQCQTNVLTKTVEFARTCIDRRRGLGMA